MPSAAVVPEGLSGKLLAVDSAGQPAPRSLVRGTPEPGGEPFPPQCHMAAPMDNVVAADEGGAETAEPGIGGDRRREATRR